MNAPFLHALQQTFVTYANRPAVVAAERTWTYAELDEHVRRKAAWLQRLGIKCGDCVVLCTANKFAFLSAHLAVLSCGAVTLPLNPRFTRDELRYFLDDSRACAAIVGSDERSTFVSLQEEKSLPGLRHLIHDDIVAEGNTGAFEPQRVSADDRCMIIYSSGTTGWPKGVVHTHGNVASSLHALADCWRLTPDDIVLNVLPLFHVHGLCFATQMTLLVGGCVILEDFDAPKTLERIRECTVFMAVPTIYYRFLEQPNFRDVAKSWTKTRLFTCGSAPIRADVLPELESILGKPVINRYGMTEAFVITSLPLDGPWPYGAVGKPLAGIDVRVDAPPGEVGGVQIRGPNLFRSYWNKPAATRDAFADGWFETGDLGSMDANGFLTLVGRKNDLIITNGYNVYPQVVERVINQCPGVRESVVLGVPDDRQGERVLAVIVREDQLLDESRVLTHLSERLVDYQRPRTIVFAESLPRNAMGKVLRRELREQMAGGKQ